jgi:FkbM family methyltransferase
LTSRSRPTRSRLAEVGVLDWLSRVRFRRKIQSRISSYPDHVVHHLYGGRDLAISLEDPVAEEWYDHDWPLPPELACLAGSRLKPGARVFDIGAHQAVMALILAGLAGPDGEVIALEAERHNYEVAARNKALNGAGNLEILHAAGGASDGWLNFSGGFNGTVLDGGRSGGSRTAAKSVDSLAETYGHPDVVFIDVEGYEHEVLRGAERTLAAASTDFFVEVHVGHGLEDLGGSARAVMEVFDPERFRRLLSPARGELEHYEFVAAEDATHLPADRFFLIATAREPLAGMSENA